MVPLTHILKHLKPLALSTLIEYFPLDDDCLSPSSTRKQCRDFFHKKTLLSHVSYMIELTIFSFLDIELLIHLGTQSLVQNTKCKRKGNRGNVGLKRVIGLAAEGKKLTSPRKFTIRKMRYPLFIDEALPKRGLES